MDVSHAVGLRSLKEEDHRERSVYRDQYPLVFDRIHHALSDSTAFTTEMSRFLPSAVRERTMAAEYGSKPWNPPAPTFSAHSHQTIRLWIKYPIR
ncbi:hypothetical protein HMPREF0620_1504 [Parascardovia denticolens DSM 10105 = JCM 12538]|uniref:Uncharacterized protein n=1 Tax=Parascardovia denticolens DSM 10105 = JCM 12538 TaxID=864564 RepID=E6K231_PARDN|nr:hypothetical protein HMPREF0620_1504 [Parascardovia denticolens DSM 10105 = JCM 12538]BAR04695.1 hypothetical protein PSDT_0176 [Parascardovia denticolens DSM 10105 = JCM 12538]